MLVTLLYLLYQVALSGYPTLPTLSGCSIRLPYSTYFIRLLYQVTLLHLLYEVAPAKHALPPVPVSAVVNDAGVVATTCAVSVMLVTMLGEETWADVHAGLCLLFLTQ